MTPALLLVQVAFADALEAMYDYPCPKARQAIERMAERANCETSAELVKRLCDRDRPLKIEGAFKALWTAEDVYRATGRTTRHWVAQLDAASPTAYFEIPQVVPGDR